MVNFACRLKGKAGNQYDIQALPINTAPLAGILFGYLFCKTQLTCFNFCLIPAGAFYCFIQLIAEQQHFVSIAEGDGSFLFQYGCNNPLN